MKITIERFKNIQSFECTAQGIVLLIGGNNAGKSSVLQAIQFGVSVAQTSSMQGEKWKHNRLSTSVGQSELVYTPIKDVLSLALNGRLTQNEKSAITIKYNGDEDDECIISVTKGKNKNIALTLEGESLGSKLQSIDKPYCAMVTGLAGIPSEEEFETNLVVRKAAARGNSNSVFRNILLQLKNAPTKWGRFQEQIGHIFPGYRIDVSFNSNTDEHINCVVTRSGNTFPIDTCGTGVLQAVQIFSYINLFEPKLLLLDEPDSHLHPNNQKALAKELIAASERGLNIVISSHSKHLVESLVDSSSLVWLRNGCVVPDTENYELKALLEIGALNIGERIVNPKYVFLTEDENTKFLEVMLEANGYSLDECDIVAYKGSTNIPTAKALLKQIKKSAPSAKYAIHCDRDFKEDNEIEDYKQEFAKMGVKTFIPDGNDIESYFAKAEHVAKACGISLPDAEEILQAAFNSKKVQLNEKYVNSRIENENKKKKEGRKNPGQIATECNQLLTSPNSKAVHGKTLVKGINSELQARRITSNLLAQTTALQTPDLMNLWDDTSIEESSQAA